MFDEICWIFELGAVQECVNLVDLVKSFQTSTYICFSLAKIGFDIARRGLSDLAKTMPKVRKTVRLPLS